MKNVCLYNTIVLPWFFALSTIVTLLLFSCSSPTDINHTSENKEFKSILIHCGVTMVKPITEIAQTIEKQENCKILITKGGSGNLYNSICTNKMGDLYLPGSEKYIVKAMKEGYVTDTVFVGKNKAAVLVQKGNPKNIEACLECLSDSSYRIVIGNPNSGSIGKETQRILNKLGIYEEIKKRAKYQTIDSRHLITALKNNEADIVINWYATTTWENNKNHVQVLDVKDKTIMKAHKLYIGRLLFSQHPDIAEKFMKYAASEKGKAVFKKYGLYE